MKTGAYLSAEAPATTGDQPGRPLLGLKRRSLAGERQTSSKLLSRFTLVKANLCHLATAFLSYLTTRSIATCFVVVMAFLTVWGVFLPLKARGHDIYGEWQTKSGVSCCHDKDCAPATPYTDDEGRLFVRQNGKVYFVPQDAILPIPSPDGRSHACIVGETVICAVIGEPRS